MIDSLVKNLRFVSSIGEYTSLIGRVIGITFRRPPAWSLIREQLFSVGVLSLGVVALTGFSTGLVLATQSFYQLADKGLVSATGLMVAKAMIMELGPVLTAFMVTGRAGAAITAELGTMRVTEQIDALETMAVDPNRFLVAPRFIAGAVMFPLLTIFSMVMGIFGGYLISVYFFHMSPTTYFDPIPDYVRPFDFFVGVVKSLVFAVLIITIACYKGIRTTGGAAGVGRTTTSSVVITYVAILVMNFIVTLGLNLVREQIDRMLA